MTIAISLPTRGRPERVVETIARTLPLMSRPDTVIVVGIDDDDQATRDALSAMPRDPHVIVDVREREDSLGAKWNRVTDYDATVYTIMSDYTPYKTEAFDHKILEAAALFPDGIGVVFSHMANWSFPSTQGLTKKLVQKLGWMYPPFFPYWFVDHWIDDIAKLIDRVSFADVQVEVPQRKIPTQELREAGFWATVYDGLRLMRRRQALEIINSPDFKEPKWRKEVLRRHYPLIEFRSQAINDSVRAMPNAAALPGGARYDRLRERALTMLLSELPAMQQELMAA